MDMEPDNDCCWKPKKEMTFESKKGTYDFYNAYGRRMGFTIRREYCKKNKFTKQIISKNFVCNKEGFRKVDKRDPLTKTSRAETRTEKHNHKLVSLDCAHMLPSQRKILANKAIELDLASESGLRLGQSFELMGKEAGGRQSLGFMKLDQKNYLRTKRQNSLAYGKVDNEEQITNMSLADAQMIMDYAQFDEDYIRFDFNLNEFFMHFERVLSEKQYKELEAEYALCQRLPRVRAPFIILSQMDNVYTKNIFEEFQDEYFLSVESDIQTIAYTDSCSLYTIVDAIGKNARKVKM
ncbi:hypothetical protein ACSBR2_015720 [Camellia fascicularis]